MKVIVYTAENCQPCRITKMNLTKKGIPFTEVPAAEHAPELKSMGYTSLPVVVVEGKASWAGYRPEMISKFIVNEVE